MTDTELKKGIEKVLKKHNPTSMSELGRLMGYGKISGSLTKKIRKLLPKLPAYLEKNKGVKALDDKPKKTTKKSRPSKKNFPPRSPHNGYRENSNYGLAFDCLYEMGRKKPVSRKDLLERYAKLSDKDLKRAGYDLAVICSVREDGRFHRSADSVSKKFPHYVKRVGDGMVQLVIK